MTMVEGTVNCSWRNYSKILANIYMNSFFFLLLIKASVRSSWMEDVPDFSSNQEIKKNNRILYYYKVIEF